MLKQPVLYLSVLRWSSRIGPIRRRKISSKNMFKNKVPTTNSKKVIGPKNVITWQQYSVVSVGIVPLGSDL